MDVSTMSDSSSTTTTAREKEQAKFKATCDKHLQSALSRNMTVRFLLDKLRGMNCPPPPGFLRCVDCGDHKMAGGGFGMIQEEIVDTTTRSHDEETKRRMATPQCQRTPEDLRKALEAQEAGKSKLKLVPEIYLCQQHVRNETHAHQSIVHELIHAIDMCRCVFFVCLVRHFFSTTLFSHRFSISI
mmetsp:Transcript_15163/g.34973  ORF Transcript_15163/g.34973 Transcript_15163/m.34973 type:complete len:186 (+) Transcript_15163:12-569(+)